MSLAGILARPLLPRPSVIPARTPAEALAPGAARRIDHGRIGDAEALDGYVRRAQRIAGVALGLGSLAAVCALLVHPAGWALALLFFLGAIFDRARGQLGAVVHIEADELVVDRGPWAGRRFGRGEIAAVGFGAARRAGRRAPETFWRADFEGSGDSHIVVVRLKTKGNGPRRFVVPEGGVAEARCAAQRLRDWHAE
jgi:hypothetical protein